MGSFRHSSGFLANFHENSRVVGIHGPYCAVSVPADASTVVG
jgi:hypothetical protein